MNIKKGVKEKFKRVDKKKFLIFLFLIILLTGIVIAENPQIFGHDPEDFNGFSWEGNVGKLTNNNIPKEGGHSTSEIENVVWFDEDGDGIEETGAILINNSISHSKLTINFTTKSGEKVSFKAYAGAQMNPGIEFFMNIQKYVNGNLEGQDVKTSESLSEELNTSPCYGITTPTQNFCVLFHIKKSDSIGTDFNAYIFDYSDRNNWKILHIYHTEYLWRDGI